MTYHDGSAFSGFSSQWRLLFHKSNDENEKGEEKGEERKNPQKTYRSQFRYDVSYDQALFCETYFALSTYHSSGVLCRGICLRYITRSLSCNSLGHVNILVTRTSSPGVLWSWDPHNVVGSTAAKSPTTLGPQRAHVSTYIRAPKRSLCLQHDVRHRTIIRGTRLP